MGTVIGSLNVSTELAIGTSPGVINFENLTLGNSSKLTYELIGGSSMADLGNVSDSLTIGTNVVLDLVQLARISHKKESTVGCYLCKALVVKQMHHKQPPNGR